MSSKRGTSRTEETRKVQFSGKSSYMIALPRGWVDEMKIQAGDEVRVSRMEDATLVISAKESRLSGKESTLVQVSPNESSGSVVRKLVSMYVLGYKVLHVKGKDGRLTPSHREVVKEAMKRHFIGTEIVADSSNEMVLQVLLSYPELSVMNAVKRMFLMTASMHKDAMAALAKADKDSATAVIKTDDEVDRFNFYAMRQLNLAVQNDSMLKEIGLLSRRDCLDYRLIVRSIERVADHAAKIAEVILTLQDAPKESLLAKIIKMSEFSVGLFEEAGLALFKSDYSEADEIVEKAKSAAQLQNDLLNAIDKVRSPGSDNALPLIVEHIRRTAEYAGDISEVVINMSAERATPLVENA